MQIAKFFNYFIIGISIFLTGCMTFHDDRGFGINYDRRTAGTVIDDNALALKANIVLTKDREIWQKCHINTLVYNNSILLVGQTPSLALKEKVNQLLYPYFKAEQIYNQLTIGEPTSFTTRAKDSWLTTQVKGKILANKNIGINRTKIITEDGIVYLMGILTKEEEDLATAIASQTKEVKQVIKITVEYQKIT